MFIGHMLFLYIRLKEIPPIQFGRKLYPYIYTHIFVLKLIIYHVNVFTNTQRDRLLNLI
jgi:hypothetical protein